MEHRKLKYEYQNGPVKVQLYDDGTKVREWDETKYGIEPELEFPESIDLKITNKCVGSIVRPNPDYNPENKKTQKYLFSECPFCHEKSGPNGAHGDFEKFVDFIDRSNLPKGIEIAVGGGNCLEYPHIGQFLNYLYRKDIMANITMNWNHLKYPFKGPKHLGYDDFGLWTLKGLRSHKINALGISLNANNIGEWYQQGVAFRQASNNIVLHFIQGITKIDTLIQNFKQFHKADLPGPKLLILGWKNFGRLAEYPQEYLKQLEDETKRWQDKIFDLVNLIKGFGGYISFDNLALERLQLLERLPKEVVDTCYCGKDGTSTMYLDWINEEYTLSSITEKRFKLKEEDTLNSIFKNVYNQRKELK